MLLKMDMFYIIGLLWKNNIGRILNKNEVIHHKDGNKHNNSIENLENLDNRQHSSLHGKLHGRKWCILKCPNCGKIFDMPQNGTNFVKNKNKQNNFQCCSRSCGNLFSYKLRKQGLTHELESAISENIQCTFQKILENSEETVNQQGSVETIRTPPEMVKK